jgi:hypothetical protein
MATVIATAQLQRRIQPLIRALSRAARCATPGAVAALLPSCEEEVINLAGFFTQPV